MFAISREGQGAKGKMTGISQRTKAGQVSRIHRNGRTGVTRRSGSLRLVGLLALVTMALAVAVIGSSVVLCIADAMKCTDDSGYQVVEVTIMPGDTLWGIAKDCFSSEVDLRVAVDDIMRTNNLSSSIVRPGQVLRIAVPIDVPAANPEPYNIRGHELLAAAGSYSHHNQRSSR